MSSSIGYAIRSGRNINSRAKGDEDPEESVKDVKNVSFGVVFSVIYLVVASYFYSQLTSLENAYGQNCTQVHTGNLDTKLQHFCEHVVSWKVCAILGIVVSGVMYLVLGCVTMCVVTRKNITLSRQMSCQRMWEAYDFLTKIVSVAIFFVLLFSDAHHFVIGNTTTFKTAALIYLIVVGIEAVLWLLAVGILLTCGFCACCLITVGCLGGCCAK